jgi:hypothetical protein
LWRKLFNNYRNKLRGLLVIGLILIGGYWFIDQGRGWQLQYSSQNGEQVKGATYNSEEACRVAERDALTDGYTATCVQ